MYDKLGDKTLKLVTTKCVMNVPKLKTYMVTGGGGLVGKQFLKLVCENNIDQVARVRLFDGNISEETEREMQADFDAADIILEVVRGDMTSYEAVARAMYGCHVVVHFAAVVDFLGLESAKDVWEVNVEGTRNLLKACCLHNVRYLVYASCMHAVCPNESGDPFVEGDEETPYSGKPFGYYGKSKMAAEKLVLSYNGEELANGKILYTCALRLAGVYGEDGPIMSSLVRNTCYRKTIYDATIAKTSLIYKGNAAWSHIVCAKKLQTDPGLVGGNAYFVKDETPDGTYNEITHHFLEDLGFQLVRIRAPYYLLLLLAWLVTVLVWVFSFFGGRKRLHLTSYSLQMATRNMTISHSKFVEDFDFVPKYSWEECRERMRRHMEELVRREKVG